MLQYDKYEGDETTFGNANTSFSFDEEGIPLGGGGLSPLPINVLLERAV